MKQVCIIGLGQFGSHLARQLATLGCEVLVIDKDESAVDRIRDDVHRAVIADARNYEALAEVVSKNVDEAIVTPGESLETSILCTLHLKKIGIEKIRAKATNQDHAAVLKAVGVTEVISPEGETAMRMAQRIMHPDLLDYLPLSPDYQVVELEAPQVFVGQSLMQLHLRRKYNVLVIALKGPAGGHTQFLPSADAVIKKGHSLVVIGKVDDIQLLRETH